MPNKQTNNAPQARQQHKQSHNTERSRGGSGWGAYSFSMYRVGDSMERLDDSPAREFELGENKKGFEWAFIAKVAYKAYSLQHY